jgi:hypothetical protein
MKKTINYILAAFSAVVLVSSCNLDLFPYGSVAYDEEGALFHNAQELGYLENGLYSSYRSGFYGEYSITEEVMTDGFNASADFGNNYGGVHRVDSDLNPGDYYIRDFWSNRYSAIKNYNVLIKGVETLPKEYKALGAQAQLVKGEAYFFRASAYLDLVRRYAAPYDAATASAENSGVPLVLVYDQNEKPARATVQEVYDQIKKDLDSAYVNLHTVSGTTVKAASLSKYKFNITVDAVNALYARYFLDVKDYTNAAAKAYEVIGSKAGYALSSSVKEFVSEYLNDEGTEAIVQLYTSIAEEGSGVNSVYTSMESSPSDVKDNSRGRYFNKPYFFPSQKLLDLYDAEDLRLACWFTINGKNNLTDEVYPTYIINSFKYDVTIFTKYLGNPKLQLTSSAVLNARQYAKPVMLGEMYLIAAEANFRNGDEPAALNALNALQEKRGANLSYNVSEAVLYNEWFKETIGEGLRLSTVKRFGKGYEKRYNQPAAVGLIMDGDSYQSKSLDPSDYHLNWPIPTNDIQTNPNLVQNPGY